NPGPYHDAMPSWTAPATAGGGVAATRGWRAVEQPAATTDPSPSSATQPRRIAGRHSAITAVWQVTLRWDPLSGPAARDDRARASGCDSPAHVVLRHSSRRR